jgi:hypothetical protein
VKLQAALARLPVERLVPWAALLPIPVWFFSSAIFTAQPAWHAVYRSGDGEPVAVETFEREMSHLWSGKYFARVAGDLEPEGFVATFEACLTRDDAAEVPFMLVADGEARFLLNGVEQLATPPEMRAGRQVSGKQIALGAGHHHLRVEFHARKRPSVALLASFDGAAPRPVGSGQIVSGTRVSRPESGSDPCGD